VRATTHALLLEPLPGESDPAGEFPLKAPPLAEMIRQARDFVAAEVPFGAFAAALRTTDTGDPAGELQLIMRELFALEEQTARAADMIERSARELPELADLLDAGLRRPVLDALTRYLGSRAKAGRLPGPGDRGRRAAARPCAASVPASGAPVSSAIQVCGLTMSYAERQVLKGVDFEVRSGEVFCLLGPNGAGKTTTVEILEGWRAAAPPT
jgi:ABC-type multidrug transport system fused ATPase/permease subunit